MYTKLIPLMALLASPAAALWHGRLLVTFVDHPDNLVDKANVWWHDMTPFDSLDDPAIVPLTDEDKARNITSDTQVQLGQMRFLGGSPLEREYVWQPKSADGTVLIKVGHVQRRASTDIQRCWLQIDEELGLKELWVWGDGRMVPAINDEAFEGDAAAIRQKSIDQYAKHRCEDVKSPPSTA